MEKETPKMEVKETQTVSRGMSSVQATMATTHQKALSRLSAAVAVIEEDEDTDVFVSESEQGAN